MEHTQLESGASKSKSRKSIKVAGSKKRDNSEKESFGGKSKTMHKDLLALQSHLKVPEKMDTGLRSRRVSNLRIQEIANVREWQARYARRQKRAEVRRKRQDNVFDDSSTEDDEEEDAGVGRKEGSETGGAEQEQEQEEEEEEKDTEAAGSSSRGNSRGRSGIKFKEGEKQNLKGPIEMSQQVISDAASGVQLDDSTIEGEGESAKPNAEEAKKKKSTTVDNWTKTKRTNENGKDTREEDNWDFFTDDEIAESDTKVSGRRKTSIVRGGVSSDSTNGRHATQQSARKVERSVSTEYADGSAGQSHRSQRSAFQRKVKEKRNSDRSFEVEEKSSMRYGGRHAKADERKVEEDTNRVQECGQKSVGSSMYESSKPTSNTGNDGISSNNVRLSETFSSGQTQDEHDALENDADGTHYDYNKQYRSDSGRSSTTTNNDPSRSKRSARVTLEPEQRIRRRNAGGPWACVVCSFENPWLNTSCKMCHSPRPSSSDSSRRGLDNQDQLDIVKGHQALLLTSKSHRRHQEQQRSVVPRLHRSESSREKTPVHALARLAAASRADQRRQVSMALRQMPGFCVVGRAA